MPPPKPGRIFLHNNWFNVPWGLGYWHTALSILIPTSTSTITTVVTDVTATTTVDAFCLAGNPAIPAFCQDRKRRAMILSASMDEQQLETRHLGVNRMNKYYYITTVTSTLTGATVTTVTNPAKPITIDGCIPSCLQQLPGC